MAHISQADHGPAQPPRPATPLSFAQRRLWFLDRLAGNRGGDGNGVEYIDPVGLHIRGPLNVPALRDAFRSVRARHHVLRSRCFVVNGQPHQVVDDDTSDLDFTVHNLSAMPEGARQRHAWELIGRASIRNFDLERDHPLRVVLVQLSLDEHLLLIVLHHIASDAWSRSILAGELSELYSASGQNRPAELPQLALQYSDIARWQRHQLSGAARERLLEFWRERLAGLVAVDLPTDRQRAASRDTTGGTVQFTLPPPRVQRVSELGRRARATPFMAFLAVYCALLSRYTDQDDLVVGTPTAGRDRVEAEDLIGCFVNMLVLRVSVADEPTFAELLGRVRDTALGAYAHQDMPFERLVDELRPARDPSVNPLFQLAFAWQNTPPASFTLPGLEVDQLDLGRSTAKFDLTLRLATRPDGAIDGELEYSTALFAETTVRRLADHYVRLLERCGAEPDTAVSKLNLLTAAERAALRADTGRLDVQAAERTLPELFEHQAASTPDAVAVSYEGTELTYRELDQRADRLAQVLRANGVVPDAVVAICAEPSVELVVGLVATAKAGGGYLPVDPNLPASRITAMLDDVDPAVLLSAEHLLGQLVHAAPAVALDRPDHATNDPARATDEMCRLAPHHLAYVIYTSGSTGKPKGVMVTHANVTRLFAAARPHVSFGPRDVWTLFHSTAFDFSVWEMWGALLHGGRLVVVPPDVVRSPHELVDLLVDQRVSVLSQTPSAFQGLLDVVIDRHITLDDLKLVVFGGEALDPNSLVPWFARHSDRGPAMVNMYGITETTVHVTHRRLSRDDARSRRSPIGWPLPDLRVWLLDAGLNPVPDGMPGEIYVAGAGLARGYLNRSALTALRFVADPFSDRPGGRLYRTGDRARRLPGGDLEYLGRVDDQVKIRGFRIEPGEIEAVLNTHPAVRQSAVAVPEPRSGAPQLVAYVVPTADNPPAFGDLRAHLAERLPAHMIPARYVTLQELPRSLGGKLSRRELPAPAPERGGTSSMRTYVPPRSPTQLAVAGTWSKVLGLDRVGLEDNFFELGGDSIRAVALVGALREQGCAVTVEMLFQHRTVERLCAALDHRTDERRADLVDTGVAPFALIGSADQAALPGDVEDAYPLSLTQAGMLFEMDFSSGAHPYHNVISYPVRNLGEFSTASFRRALDILAERHEILRTSVDLVTYDEPLQLVHRTATVPLTVHDLNGLDATAAQDAVIATQRSESTRLFDISAAPLIRVHIHVRAADHWEVTITESHAILDGWSHHSLVSELLHLYQAVQRHAADDGVADISTPVPPSVRFADFIQLERQALHDPDSREFWRRRLIEFAREELFDARDAPQAGPSRLHRERILLADLQTRLRTIADDEGLPLKTLLLTAHIAALASVTGTRQVTTGLVCNGRPEVRGGDQVYGMFLNTVPFRMDVTGTWRELLHAVYDEELALWPHRRFPLPAMQHEWGQRKRLLEVLFSYMDFYILDEELVDVAGIVKSLPLEFAIQVTTEPGAVIISGEPGRAGPTVVRRLATEYRWALEEMAEGHRKAGPSSLGGPR